MGETSTMDDQQTDEDRLRFTRADAQARRLVTCISVCLDTSGSMGDKDPDGASKKDAAIAAFNAYLHEQQAEDVDDCLMNLVQFSVSARVAQPTAPVRAIVPLTNLTYLPGGGTALFDAIAFAVAEAEKVTADRYVVCILTDGEENSSHETTLEQVRALITGKEAEGNWTFTYLSADVNAFAQAMSYGIAVGNTQSYTPTAGGTFVGANAMGAATRAFRGGLQGQSMSFYADAQAPPPAAVTYATPPPTPTDDDEDDQP